MDSRTKQARCFHASNCEEAVNACPNKGAEALDDVCPDEGFRSASSLVLAPWWPLGPVFAITHRRIWMSSESAGVQIKSYQFSQRPCHGVRYQRQWLTYFKCPPNSSYFEDHSESDAFDDGSSGIGNRWRLTVEADQRFIKSPKTISSPLMCKHG